MQPFVMIILCSAIFYPRVLATYFRNFPREPEKNQYDFDYTSETQNGTLNISSDISEIGNSTSVNPTDDQRLESTSNILTTENFKTEESNSTFTSTSSLNSSKNIPNTQSTQVGITLTEIFSNESNSTSSVPHSSGSSSNSVEQTKSSIKSESSGTPTHEGITVSSTEDEEQEGVVRGKPFSTEITSITTSKPETIYQKTLALINDTYTLSIIIPVAAGVVFASTIIVTIATCRCLRRQCRHRRVRKKTLPDSIKNLRPSDRARLLAESSDEEF